MKYDLGCGYKHRDGFTRVDKDERAVPDICHDLDKTPWPIESDSADEIVMCHSLEHLAPLPEDYKKVWQEIYRICKPEARISIDVPHWLHENFFHDPTHVRPITPVTIAMMDQTRNRADMAAGGMETTLGLQWGVDFSLERVGYNHNPNTGDPMACHYEVVAKKPQRG